MAFGKLQQICCILVLTFLMTANSLPVGSSILEMGERSVVKRAIRRRPGGGPVRRTIIEGHTFELRCKAYGVTPPIIHWLFNGTHVEQSPLDHLAENVLPPLSSEAEERAAAGGGLAVGNTYFTTSKLVIRDASSADAGLYTCVADLPGSRETKTYNISVTSSEELNRRSESTYKAADVRMYMYTDTVFEFENVSSVLICRATQGPSKPPPVITWLLDGAPITNQHNNFQIQSNGDLKILKTGLSVHRADIKCVATADSGNFAEVEPFIYIFAPNDD